MTRELARREGRRVTIRIQSTTCRVVGTGNTACCKVTVKLIEVAGTVLQGRGIMLPIKTLLRKRCNRDSIFIKVPSLVAEGNIGGVIRLSLARSRGEGLTESIRALGSVRGSTL